LEFLSPTEIVYAEIALTVAFTATLIASIQFIYKTRAAKKYDSLALKTDAFNSVKDVLTSLTAFFAIILSKYFNIVQTDGIAGIIIALVVFTVAYTIIKEASLVLMDACQCSDIVSDVENIAKTVTHVKGVHDIRLRKLGPYVVGDMHVEVDGKMTVNEAHELITQIEEKIKQEFDEIAEIKVRIEPHGK
jgi:cation diffusion facilitator family transporter